MPSRPKPGAWTAVPGVEREQLRLRGRDENPAAARRVRRRPLSSSQAATPRLAKSPYVTSRAIFGSNTQRSRPVAASSAITRPSGVPTNIDAVHDERRRLECRGFLRLEALVGFAGAVGPGHLQPADVVARDFRGGEIACPFEVAAVRHPGDLLRPRNRDDKYKQQENRAQVPVLDPSAAY